jgi:5-methylcytosine-specific restriction endonuclease McrA
MTLAAQPVRHPHSISDRRYSTSAWQRTRKAVLLRDGYQCMIRGPRCTGTASTVHHVIPSSERPDLFYASSNLVSASAKCNYGGGRAIAVDRTRDKIEALKQIIEQQWLQIAELTDRIAELENAQPTPQIKTGHVPAIY